ncbi:HAD family hydrolase [Eisenbergiella sp.]
MPATLYISDLDGTLMKSDQTISAFTADAINRLVKQGLHFSYATARSILTASKITANVTAEIPVIVYNGSFIQDSKTHEILYSRFFDKASAGLILRQLLSSGVYPIVYSHSDGREKFSYRRDKLNSGISAFLSERRNDVRNTPVADAAQLPTDGCFYFTCIDSEEKLYPLYRHFKEDFYCVYQKDIYSGEQWLEIMPAKTSKADAVLHLARLLGCTRIVCFGDGKNDIPMFHIADECYAVANADPELKAIATGIIPGNNEDGVAKWLLTYACNQRY